MEIAGRPVRTSISVGIAHHEGGATSADERRETFPRSRGPVPHGDAAEAAAHRESAAHGLLRTADGAMYAAKGAGKGRAVLARTDESAAVLVRTARWFTPPVRGAGVSLEGAVGWA